MTPLWFYYGICTLAWLLHFAWLALSAAPPDHKTLGQSPEPARRSPSRAVKGGLSLLTLAILASIGIAIYENTKQFPETTLLRGGAVSMQRGVGVIASVWMCLGLLIYLTSTWAASRRQRSFSADGLPTASLSKRVARSVRWFVVLASIIAVVTTAVWLFPLVTKPRNPFAKLPPPIRLTFAPSGFRTGAADAQPIGEGPERAAAFQTLLAQATSPGKYKCQWLGEVTLHYASGETRTVGLGCCTVWIDGKSWNLGGSAGEQFFSQPSDPASR